MPVMDLYDTQMMGMAIRAAKEERDLAQERLDKFNTLYGSYYSPSDKDMQRWNDIFQQYKGAIDDIYARGEDPTRTVEGRAAIAALNRNLPYKDMNELWQSAANSKEYYKNVAKLQADDLYDPDFQKAIGIVDPKDWDTQNMGVFNTLSPKPLSSLHDDTEFLYKGRTAGPLTQKEVEDAGFVYDPNKEYEGYTRNRMIQQAKDNLPDYLSTPTGRYRAMQARQAIEQENASAGIKTPVTEDQVNTRLAEWIADANPSYRIDPTGTLKKTVGSYGKYGGSGRIASSSTDDNYVPQYDDSGREIPQINFDNHNIRVEATGISNLFGGERSNMGDYATNFRTWGEKMKNIEHDIIKEIGTLQSNGDGKKVLNYDTNTWKNRHMTTYNAANFAKFMMGRGAVPKGGSNSSNIILNDETVNNLYSFGDVMKKNIEHTVRARGSARKDSKAERSAIRTRFNAGGSPYMHSTGRIFTQVEQDGRVHHYAEVYVKRNKVDTQDATKKDYQTHVMYFDMGLESKQWGLAEESHNYQRNAYGNYMGTYPYAEGKKDASVVTQK